MPSDLQITNIRDQANANSAITIGSDGQITVNQNNPTLTLGTNASGFTGIKYAHQWRLTANNTATSEQGDNTGQGSIGSAMTESSGVFTFPTTGIWLILLTGQWSSDSDGISYGGLHLYESVNAGSGDTYTVATETYANMDHTNYLQSQSAEYLFDCTNVTTHKVKFYAHKISANANLLGSTTYNRTHFTFIRLGDT
jgi:hypothetical protein